MDVTFLITCYKHEDLLPRTVNYIQNFKTIKPTFFTVYAGDRNIPCHLKIKPGNLRALDLVMITQGVKAIKKQIKANRILKINANIWLLDENKIVEIFNRIDETKAPYAGNLWHHNLPGSLSVDFFALNLDYGDIFSNVTTITNDSEVTVYTLLKKYNKQPYLIPERAPVHWNNRWECEDLKMTMYNTIEENEAAIGFWRK